MIRQPWFRPALVAAIVALLGWVTYGVIHAGADVPPPLTTGTTQLDRGSIAGKRVDGKAWSLDYRSMSIGADGSTMTIDGVEHGRVDRDGKPYFAVRAVHVTANPATGDFAATGPVSFREIDGKHARTIETVDATYIGATKRLLLPHEVRITSDGGVLVVARASFDLHTGDLKLGRITATR